MIKGVIIDPDYENAENTKAIMEETVKHLKMHIFKTKAEGMTFVPTAGIDFIMASAAPVDEQIIAEQLSPFIKYTLNSKCDYIKVRKNKEVLFIDRSSIIGIEVMGKHCYIHTLDNEFVITRITLHSLIDLLEEPMLIRCHKSFAVNIKHINGIKREGRNRWRPRFNVDSTFECYISDRYVKRVVEMLDERTNSSLSIFLKG